MKKGFTLIELLAVIVILAIIALIATPIILNIVEDSKKESVLQSTKIYTSGLQTTIMSENMKTSLNPEICIIENEVITCDAYLLDYEITGEKPTSGYFKFENGTIEEYSVCLNGYKITNDGTTITTTKTAECSIELPETEVEFNGTKEIVANSTHKGIVYMDPTDLSATCTSNDVVNVTGLENKSGCMKFYIYDDEGLSYKLILDRNTSGDVAWNSNDVNTSMLEVQARLLDDTENWVGNPRLITADEIAHIVGADRSDTIKFDSSKDYSTSGSNIETKASWFYFDGSGNTYSSWQTKVASSENLSSYAWLFDYIHDCDESGCNIEEKTKYPYPTKTSETTDYVEGYWTSTPVVGQTNDAWYVQDGGRLRIYNVATNSHNGVRPVITIPKNIID